MIGLQRERVGSEFGGIRTFPLVALLGTVSGFLAERWGALVLLGSFLALSSVVLVGNLHKRGRSNDTSGQTTEVAALLTYACGALLTTDYRPAGIVVGGLTAVLLHLKQPLHAFAGRLSQRDLQGIMRFAIVSLIVLPLLPAQTFGPYDVLNPREICWMVVLIVGIGLVGYVSYRLFSGNAGILFAGVLGGLVSSTATTVAYARRVRENASATTMTAVVIGIASTVAAARVIVEVAVVAPRILPDIGLPLAAFFAWMVLISVGLLHAARKDPNEMPEPSNPAELRSTLVFAIIYALVIFVTAAAKDYFGERALYVVAFVSGFVDVDAITLSTAQLASQERLSPQAAWHIILIATLLGSTRLFVRLALPVGTAIVGGLTLFVFWP